MRRISRIYEPLADAAITRSASPAPSRYICRACLRQRSATRLPSSLASRSRFSTSARQAAFMEKVTDALKGETKLFGKVEEENKDENYKAADTWDGLEWVGTKEWYEQQKRPAEPFASFGPKTGPMMDRIQIRDELLKSIIEVYTMERHFPQHRPITSRVIPDVLKFPDGVRIGSDARTGDPIFELPEKGEAAFVRELRSAENNDLAAPSDAESTRSELAAPSAEEKNEANFISPQPAFTFADLKDPSAGKWSSISLENLDFRFAVAKRVQQRTGIRLQDPQINHAKTAGAMFVHLWKPKKPKKTAEALLANENLASLPNVKIADHRVTFVHREKEVGRWKVIEEELTERNIQPLGRPDRAVPL